MLILHPQYIKDKNDKNSLVILPINEFEALMDELDELQDIKLYDDAKNSNEISYSLEEAFEIIESYRKTVK